MIHANSRGNRQTQKTMHLEFLDNHDNIRLHLCRSVVCFSANPLICLYIYVPLDAPVQSLHFSLAQYRHFITKFNLAKNTKIIYI